MTGHLEPFKKTNGLHLIPMMAHAPGSGLNKLEKLSKLSRKWLEIRLKLHFYKIYLIFQKYFREDGHGPKLVENYIIIVNL